MGALKAIGRFGAKSPTNLAITLGTTALVAPKVGELAYKAKETISNKTKTIGNVFNNDNKSKKDTKTKYKKYENPDDGSIPGRYSDETLTDYKKRRYDGYQKQIDKI